MLRQTVAAMAQHWESQAHESSMYLNKDGNALFTATKLSSSSATAQPQNVNWIQLGYSHASTYMYA